MNGNQQIFEISGVTGLSVMKALNSLPSNKENVMIQDMIDYVEDEIIAFDKIKISKEIDTDYFIAAPVEVK